MESIEEIESKILKITMTIQNEFPELVKYFSEMTITIPDMQNPEITASNLNDYYNSLKAILDGYIEGNSEKQ